MKDYWNENQCLNPLSSRYLQCGCTKFPWTYGLAVDSFDPQAHAADVPGESNSRRAEYMRRKRDDPGLLAIPFSHRGLTYNEFSGPSLDLGRTRSLPPNDRRRQAHWYQQSLNGLSRRHYAQCFWQQLITVKPIQMHDNRYGREMVGYCWIRARATRNLKLEPEPDYDHAQISAQMIKVRFFYSELLESLK
jgi:hypothetical protein